MTTGYDSNLTVSPTEERLLSTLRRQGPQSLDGLCALPEIGVSQGLLAVDRLSRAGVVSIELIGPCDYRVSLVEESR
jgi:predicted transcriptional regulator